MAEKIYDVIVVGGGIAGLTAAAWLSKKGRQVLLIEKNDKCGGLVNSFKRNGFQFEAGVRALEDAGIIFPMLKELDIELEVVRSKVSVGVEQEIIQVEDIHSLNDYREMLLKLYPESKEDIENVMKVIRRIMRHMDVLYDVENPIIKDVWKDKKFIFTRLLPWLPKFLFTIRKINRMNMPMEEYLKTIINDPSLRDIISQHFFRDTPTFFAVSYFSLYLDYFYPKGGVGKLADAVEAKLLALGGEIKYKTTIGEVVAGDNIVVDQDKQAYKYKKLIWAGDLKTLYKVTDTQGLSNKIRSGFDDVKARLLARRGGDSVYTLFLQVDEPLDSFGAIATGHFFYSPLRTGLGETHRSELNRLLDNWEAITKAELFAWVEKFARLNTYEISIPGLKDPSLCPEGKTGMVISFLTEYDLFNKVSESGWYEEFMLHMERCVVAAMADSVYPMLKDKILSSFAFTPLSIQNRVASSEGAIVGWSFQEPIPVVHKMQQAAKAVLTPIPSIFVAGQWTFSPAGVPMSILTGKLAADKVLSRK
jgi:phytoene dehydrogenase-like protein